MNVIRHPASRGLTWLRAGIQIMARQPVALLMLTFVQFLVLFIPLLVLPLIGSGIMTALMPVMYLGLMTAIRAAEQGETPTPMHLFEPFRADSKGIWKQLMMFGLISGVFMLAAVTLSRVAVPPPEFGPGAAQLSPDEMAQLALGQLYTLGLAALFSIPVQMASWFSPMFIAWHDQGIGKAMFFSVVAVWRNKWPFLVLFAGWSAIIIALTLGISLLMMLLGFPLTATNAMMLPMLLVFLASAYCTFWVTYRDIIQ
jgi:hypothetical protein